MKTSFTVAAAGALALLSGGCATMKHEATPVDNLPTTADAHKIAVSEGAERLEVPVPETAAAISYDTAASIETFARLYVRQGHGALVLSAPEGGANEDAARVLMQDVRMRLATAGVPYAAMASASYAAPAGKDAPIILSFGSFTAEAPDCAPLWSQDLSHEPANQPWESFGCSMQANLAAMISDPADLLGPRAEDPRDAARRARVLEAYRQGQQSHAERTNDERVQVSKAVR